MCSNYLETGLVLTCSSVSTHLSLYQDYFQLSVRSTGLYGQYSCCERLNVRSRNKTARSHTIYKNMSVLFFSQKISVLMFQV